MPTKTAAFLIASVLCAGRGEPAIARVHRPLAGVTKLTVSIHLQLNDPLPPVLLERDFRNRIAGRLRAVGVKVVTCEEARQDPPILPPWT